MSEGLTRVCIHCGVPVPVERFTGGPRTRVCVKHAKAARINYAVGNPRRRAFNCLRLRARHDRFAFGHDFIRLSREEALALLTEARIPEFSRWSLMPRDPERVLEVGNMVLVTNYQRHYLMSQWRTMRSPAAYKEHLAFLREGGIELFYAPGT